ncbi:MAG TPA: MBL fold metallo-hydrolase [Pseudonocardia sp.]|nr:MBL fold metallo-hydrolase [Pseudonocardia sp.]
MSAGRRPTDRTKGRRASGTGGLAFACLGSSGAVPSAARDTTALVIRAGRSTCLVDVGGSPVQKLRRVGVDPVALSAVVVTHTHPDHVYGLPALIQCLVIVGRRTPLPVYCRVEHTELVGRLLDLFGLRDEGFPVPVVPVEPREGVHVLETPDLVLTASPNAHGRMPNLAIRVDAGGRSVVYSSDTRPCAEVERLARGAAVLVHEATFARPDPTQWHSTALEAGRVARAAGVGRLYLAHVGYTVHGALRSHAAAARAGFGGAVAMAEELRWYRA